MPAGLADIITATVILHFLHRCITEQSTLLGLLSALLCCDGLLLDLNLSLKLLLSFFLLLLLLLLLFALAQVVGLIESLGHATAFLAEAGAFGIPFVYDPVQKGDHRVNYCELHEHSCHACVVPYPRNLPAEHGSEIDQVVVDVTHYGYDDCVPHEVSHFLFLLIFDDGHFQLSQRHIPYELRIRHLQEATDNEHHYHATEGHHEGYGELIHCEAACLSGKVWDHERVLSVVEEYATDKPEHRDITVQQRPSNVSWTQDAGHVKQTQDQTAVDDEVLKPKERLFSLFLQLLESVLHAAEKFLISRIKLTLDLSKIILDLVLIHSRQLADIGYNFLSEFFLRHTLYIIKPHLHQFSVQVVRVLLRLKYFKYFLMPQVLLLLFLIEYAQVFLLFR